jgi:hypothetical protein
VFGTRRQDWRPDMPDACAEPFIPVLWLQVLELLERVPKGSPVKFLEDGIPPDWPGPQFSSKSTPPRPFGQRRRSF